MSDAIVKFDVAADLYAAAKTCMLDRKLEISSHIS